MRTKIVLSLTAAAFLLLPCANAADNYRIDPAHTSLTFSVRHMGIGNVKGHFDEFAGLIVLDDGAVKRRPTARYSEKHQHWSSETG
jgi:polyisoprenoid-binding protein YceI